MIMEDRSSRSRRKTYLDSLQESHIPQFSSQQHQVELLHQEEGSETLLVLFRWRNENEVPGRRNDIHRLSDHRTGSWPGCTSVLRSCVLEFSKNETVKTITKKTKFGNHVAPYVVGSSLRSLPRALAYTVRAPRIYLSRFAHIARVHMSHFVLGSLKLPVWSKPYSANNKVTNVIFLYIRS